MNSKLNRSINTNLLNQFVANGGVRQVFFAITNRCDANCDFCGFKSSSKMKRKSTKLIEIKKSLDYMFENGVRIISFTGGEPLLHPDLPEIVSYASQLGMLTRTGTNAIRLDESMIERLKDAGLGYLWISIDSDDPNAHNQNRGQNGLFSHIIDMVDIAGKYDLKIGAGVAISKLINNYDNLFSLLSDVGFSRVTFAYPGETMESSYLANSSNAISSFSKEELAVVLNKILKIKLNNTTNIEIGNSTMAIKMMIQRLQHGTPLSPCFAGSRLFYLDWRLRLYRCYSLSDYSPLFEFDFSNPQPSPCDACNSQCFRDNSIYYPAIENANSSQSLLAWLELITSSQNPFIELE